MKIYTFTGDDGTTSLAGGKRVPKYHQRVEACGSVEELISWIGLLRDLMETGERVGVLLYIQNQLMFCTATLASDTDTPLPLQYLPDPDSVSFLEQEIDKMEGELTTLSNFILPGGNSLVSYCNIARCVCRRAEREVARLNETDKTPEIICQFLNRLADFLFVLSRKISLELDIDEVKWPL